ncbi:MAG: DUF5660 family protein [Patescibacteria group bacterium]
MNDTSKKNQPKAYLNDSLIEQLRDVGKGVAKTVGNDVLGGITSDALSSLFGTPKSGDMKPGQAVNVGTDPKSPMFPPNPFDGPMPFPSPFERQPMGYGRREQFHSQYSQEVIAKIKEQESQVVKKIEEIREELRALIVTLKSVDRQVRQAVSENMVDPGIYHLNFLDRLKTVLKLIRQNISESGSWLNVMKSKKKQRSYWAMYKKKGTEFGLNPDRVVSTQVG